MKWTSRILILAVFFAAVVCGCQKAPKSGASKEKGSEATAKAGSTGSKHASGAKSSKGSAKSGATAEKSEKATSKKEAAKREAAKKETAAEKAASTHAPHPGILTQADDGRSFEVKQGEVIVVKLDSDHSVGFSWAVTDGPGPALKQEGSPVYARTMSKKGKAVGGTETWRFRAVSAGRVTVKMEYRRSWERNIPERAFRVTVTVR